MDDHEGYLSLAEAAKAFDKSTKTILRWLRNGQLAGQKVEGPYGPEWRIPASAVSDAQQVIDVIPVKRDLSAQMLELLIQRALADHAEHFRQVIREEVRAEVAGALDTQDKRAREREELRDSRVVAQIREALRESQEQQRRRRWPWSRE